MLTKEMSKYMKAHPLYNAFVHILIGLGVGALLAYPVFADHPIRWAIILIGLGVLGHVYAAVSKK